MSFIVIYNKTKHLVCKLGNDHVFCYPINFCFFGPCSVIWQQIELIYQLYIRFPSNFPRIYHFAIIIGSLHPRVVYVNLILMLYSSIGLFGKKTRRVKICPPIAFLQNPFKPPKHFFFIPFSSIPLSPKWCRAELFTCNDKMLH